MKQIFLAAALVACGCGGKPFPDDDFSGLAPLDGKADAFSGKLKVVGTLAYGDSLTTRYTKTPLYRAAQFTGAAGDAIDAWVRSSQGDAVAWLLDGANHVLAKNDDADASTSDSHLAVTLAAAGTYSIVFRDYNEASHYFTVSLDGTAGSGCPIKLSRGGGNSGTTGYASLLESDGAGWALTTAKLPACADYGDASGQAQLRQALANAGLVGAGGTAQASAVGAGGVGFVQMLDQSLRDLHAAAGPDAHADALEQSLKQPVQATPDAFLEVRLTDASCGDSADALVDTRTGTLYVIHHLSTSC